MAETYTEWGVRAFHPCPAHGAKCPHSHTSVHNYGSRSLAERAMGWTDVPGVDVAVDRVLVSRTVTDWTGA